MKPTPYLFFNGQCRDAIAAYERILGATAHDVMPASQMPADFPVPKGKENWVMHARLTIADGEIMMSDDVFEETSAMAGCSVMLSYPSAAEGKVIFDQLAEGGEINMAWEPTFWSAGFGTLVDRFGVKWMIGTDEMPKAG